MSCRPWNGYLRRGVPLAAVLGLLGPATAAAADPLPDAAPQTALLAPDPAPKPAPALSAAGVRPVLPYQAPRVSAAPRAVITVPAPRTVTTVVRPRARTVAPPAQRHPAQRHPAKRQHRARPAHPKPRSQPSAARPAVPERPAQPRPAPTLAAAPVVPSVVPQPGGRADAALLALAAAAAVAAAGIGTILVWSRLGEHAS